MSIIDIDDIHNGNQDALSYRNEWAFLIMTISTINSDIISDEKINGEILLNNHKDRRS